MFRVKFAHGHESVVDDENLVVVLFELFRRPMQRSQQPILSCDLTGM